MSDLKRPVETVLPDPGAPRDPSPGPVYPPEWESDVVLADGGTVRLRPLRASDDDRLVGLYSRMSEASRYFRFFSAVPASMAGHLERLRELDYERRFALVAELGDVVVAAAGYVRQGDDEAEVAFAVQDDQQGRGLGTILLEHLSAAAREHGIRRFVAEVLAANHKMLRVFTDAGFDIHRAHEHGTVEVTFDIAPTPASLEAQYVREHASEARSVARLLAPRTVAVIGASRAPGSIGHAILRNLLEGDFAGSVYPVNPNATSVGGVRSYPSVLDVPDHVDLAVIAVPAPAALEVVQDCVRKGVHGLVVISAGFAEVPGGHDREREVVTLARRNGVRVIGPNCMGVVNTHPDVRMTATFAPFAPTQGRIGFASQSGGLGIALLARAAERGLGVSTFVSMGNKADVSSNDLLQYWEDDPDTDVILLYLESFGNPRKFARLARRIARHKPIVAVKSGRTPAGARGTASHTAALASPDVAVDALFDQAGVIRVDTLQELFDTATLLAHQPLPAGRRVAIVSNGGGPGILAADACVAAGLEVPELSETTQAALRSFASPEAGLRNPVDLVASAAPTTFERTLAVLLADDGIDAVLVIFVPPLVAQTDDVAQAILATTAQPSAKPVLACFLGRADSRGVLTSLDGSRCIPKFAFPEAAAASLGRAAKLAEWRRRPVGIVPALAGVDLGRARALVRDQLSQHPEGEWIAPQVALEVLGSFGIPVVETRWASTAAGAVAAAEEIGLPVAVKAGSGTLIHKTDVGGVRLGLDSIDAARDAFTEMHATLGDRMGGAIVQPMMPAGVETIVGVTHDPSFGSLVLFGMGGFAAELLRDTALRVVPLTDLDAHELVRSLRASPLLFGFRNTPEVDVAALENLLLRVGLLAEHLPEVAELDCNPVIVSPTSATVVDVKLRLAPHAPTAPETLRRL